MPISDRSRKDNAMTEAASSTVGDREVTITRVFDAPRELVWKAWTEPEHFSQWFGGGHPMTVPLERVTMDVRPGGAWSATMVNANDGTELPFRGTYREVVEPERLVLVFEDVHDPDNPNVEVLTATFTDVGGKTEVVAHQAGNMPQEQYPLLAEGYGKFFDKLAEHLATL
jgi:uncharacterized protein YndB with AHSA1/START domain